MQTQRYSVVVSPCILTYRTKNIKLHWPGVCCASYLTTQNSYRLIFFFFFSINLWKIFRSPIKCHKLYQVQIILCAANALTHRTRDRTIICINTDASRSSNCLRNEATFHYARLLCSQCHSQPLPQICFCYLCNTLRTAVELLVLVTSVLRIFPQSKHHTK